MGFLRVAIRYVLNIHKFKSANMEEERKSENVKKKEGNLLCFLFLSSIRKQLWKKWCNKWEWWLVLFPSQKRSVTAKQPRASWDCPQRRNCHKKERATCPICNLPTPNLPRTKQLRTQRQQKSLDNSDLKLTIFFFLANWRKMCPKKTILVHAWCPFVLDYSRGRDSRGLVRQIISTVWLGRWDTPAAKTFSVWPAEQQSVVCVYMENSPFQWATFILWLHFKVKSRLIRNLI